MGTTLTGTTPQDTYDSLIKVTDNGPLSGTAKYLSDGLGNDSALALSTSLVGIGTSSPSYQLDLQGGTTNNSRIRLLRGTDDANQFMVLGFSNISLHRNVSLASAQTDLSINQVGSDGTRTPFYISSAGNVGIGTSTPASGVRLHVQASDAGGQNLRIQTSVAAGRNYLQFGNASGDMGYLGYGGADSKFFVANLLNDDVLFVTNGTERMRILAGGGLTFNGDTAQANALDDYEEGTWTMGIAFDNGATGVTYSSNTGRYTKIGRQVTVVGYLALTNKGSSTGNATITGLPFTIGSGNSNYSASSISNLANVTFADFPQLRGEIGTTNILFLETTNAGALSALANGDFANNSEVMISFTYFV
jgi:hypothetical protein